MGEEQKFEFGNQLLLHIRYGRNEEAKSLLNKRLVDANDTYGTLLHYAAIYGNREFARHLINIGTAVDSLGNAGRTPLMIAVRHCHANVAEVLFEANADIDVVNDDGQSVLQIIFDRECSMTQIYPLVFNKLTVGETTIGNIVSKLTKAGCTLYHTAYFNNFDVMESMLKSGVDVDSRGYSGMTALHAAAELNDFQLVKWLVEKGANVNARNQHGVSAILIASKHRNNALLEFLLMEGANPNVKSCRLGVTPLHVVTSSTTGIVDGNALELLLRYGAIPRDTHVYLKIFDFVLYSMMRPVRTTYYLGQLAILQQWDKANAKSAMRFHFETVQSKLFGEFESHYKLCLLTLSIEMFDKLTLVDLLSASDLKMRTYVRNEAFTPKIMEVCAEKEFAKLIPDYYHKLMERINEAGHLVKLENFVISTLCSFYSGNTNEFYYAARKVVGYLNKRHLEKLVPLGSM